MAWSKVAQVVAKYRHSVTIVLAAAISLLINKDTLLTFGLRYGVFKACVFIFVLFAVPLVILFAFLLAVAETKAEAERRAPAPEFPTAVARTVTPVAPPKRVVAVAPLPPASPKPPEPPRAPGDGPSILR